MSVMTIRGGIPIVRRMTTNTTGGKTTVPGPTNYLIARNKDAANTVRIYFSQEDFDADVNFIELPSITTSAPYGEWQGPVELAPNTKYSDLWWKAAVGTPVVELTFFLRHG